MEFLFVLCLCTAVASLPSPDSEDTNLYPPLLSEDDYTFLQALPRHRISKLPAGFKYIFVEANGQVAYTRDPNRIQIEIAASPLSLNGSLEVAADIVAKMSRYMPSEIFFTLANRTSLGVFSKAEKLIVYPEFAYLANGDCGSMCNGTCKKTCTHDHRKYENIAGVGGNRGVALDDNIMCTSHDPYRKKHNVLSHEYTHTIHQHALPSDIKTQISQAYYAAKSAQTWKLNSYTMSTKLEYFAVAATVFFGVDKYGLSFFGGMNSCGTGLCQNEMDGRNLLKTKDPKLFDILSHVFTSDNPTLPSGLTVCPSKSSSVVVG